MIIYVSFVITKKTIIHILWECPKVQELLDNFSILCKRKNIEVPKESCFFILGCLSPSSREMNTILLCFKSFIYRSKCCNETLTLQGLHGDIKILLSIWNIMLQKMILLSVKWIWNSVEKMVFTCVRPWNRKQMTLEYFFF